MTDISLSMRQEALAYAKDLVRDQNDPDMTPYDRLWSIAKKLNVSRIDPGASRSQGFVKRLDDGSFGIFYSGAMSLARRRYTVAHELAHLVLEKFHHHVSQEATVARQGMRDTSLERIVDRIAAELLMPEHLVASCLIEECSRQRKNGKGIDKYEVLSELRNRLGVSESAMAFRTIEIEQVLAVIIRIMMEDAPHKLRNQSPIIQRSSQGDLVIDDDIAKLRKLAKLASTDRAATSHDITISSALGRRILRCQGWLRMLPYMDSKYHEYWIVGWTWNTAQIPVFDDSTQFDLD